MCVIEVVGNDNTANNNVCNINNILSTEALHNKIPFCPLLSKKPRNFKVNELSLNIVRLCLYLTRSVFTKWNNNL